MKPDKLTKLMIIKQLCIVLLLMTPHWQCTDSCSARWICVFYFLFEGGVVVADFIRQEHNTYRGPASSWK